MQDTDRNAVTDRQQVCPSGSLPTWPSSRQLASTDWGLKTRKPGLPGLAVITRKGVTDRPESPSQQGCLSHATEPGWGSVAMLTPGDPGEEERK